MPIRGFKSPVVAVTYFQLLNSEQYRIFFNSSTQGEMNYAEFVKNPSYAVGWQQ